MATSPITVEKVPVNGALILSATVQGDGSPFRLHRTYYGYSRSEARAMFRILVIENGGYAR